MTLVCAAEKGLLAAGERAKYLTMTRRIQGWELSNECAGIVINLFPDMAGCVIEKGGPTQYRADLLKQFTDMGYKEYEVPKEVPIPEPPKTATAAQATLKMEK